MQIYSGNKIFYVIRNPKKKSKFEIVAAWIKTYTHEAK